MTRISQITHEKAQPEILTIFRGVEKKMGMVPNIFKNMANSPAVLKGYLGISEALNSTSLDSKLREKIALAVSQSNHCGYCLSAHTLVAKTVGVPEQEILIARKGEADDPKTNAILLFSKNVIEKKGKVTDQEIASLKKAGITDTELAEIVLTIVATMFTNYFNNITDPVIDFPEAPKLN